MWRRAAARASSGSVLSTTACSGQSHGPAPSASRATAVCSTGTKYGWAPAAFSSASSSIFGPRAASTRGGGSAGRGAT